MTAVSPDILARAIDWHVSLGEADASRWHDFVAWLEADRRHAEAYDRVALDDSRLSRPLPAPARVEPALPWRRVAGLAAAAAALAASVAVFAPRPAADTRYTVATGPAGGRTLALADGSTVVLNRSTRLILDRDAPRRATLVAGEAMFQVRHDAAAPFQVTAGGATLIDTGTAFDVVAAPGRLEVAVAAGGVRAELGGGTVDLGPGMRLSHRGVGGVATVRRVAVADVAGWTRGRLVFTDTPLADVAADVARAGGTVIVVAPELRNARFTGTLMVTTPAATVATLAALAGATAQREPGGWRLNG